MYRPSFEILSGWFESVSSNLIRGLPFPKDLQEEINSFVANIKGSPGSSECTTPDTSFSYSSNSSFGSPACLPSSNNSSYADCSLSSSCSSLSTFIKPGRLHSIREITIDHSSNNNSLYSSTIPSPVEMDHSLLSCTSRNNRTLSASPS